MAKKDVNLLNEKKDKSDSIFSFKGRRFQNGSFSAAMILIAVAIVIVVNLIVSKLPVKYTEFDVSSNQVYSMSDKSKKLLETLKDEVTIYYLVGTTEKEGYAEVTSMLEKYKDASDKIKVVQKDPELYPSFGDQYEAESTTTLIVESEKRYKVVDKAELYTISNAEDYYYGATAEYAFSGESAIANAINYVVTDKLPKVYELQGNGETALADSVKEIIESGNIAVESLNLLTSGEVPEDADCLIINAPTNDFSKDTADAIIKYLKNGGNGVILSNYIEGDKEMPNFNSVLEAYGVAIEKGIIYEGDSNYTSGNSPTYTVPDIKSLDLSIELVENNAKVFMPSAQSIVELKDKSDTINVAQLLTTSNSAYLKEKPESATTYEKEDKDKEGTFNMGVVITDGEETEESSEDTETTEENIKTKLVVYGTTALVDESIMSQVTTNNVALFASTLGWMCDTEDSISIASKSLSEESLTVTDSQATTWMVVYLIALPVLVISTGIFVVSRRKNRNSRFNL